MILRPPRSTLARWSAASDVDKRQGNTFLEDFFYARVARSLGARFILEICDSPLVILNLTLIHISEPTRPS